ncbi:GNAT family N-acetyltransferase [Halobacillus amylolyticus]|uniref:GNAT family N-acetyltransferase n=1 Tax=Halobacillus amylolyticus TaxID=2932259 RepID=A0ABY4HEY0_9BACI|nr:GNAT family N-acetyltransferase [Halobacillus amylolyticus]UOR13356.1 GNAT family N-acetyltransferase [Halobacillus amylolyticus]
MGIIPNHKLDRSVVTEFFISHWGSSQMVTSSGIFQCDQLEGFSMLGEKGDILGLITYITEADECEIISLDSVLENRGIGTLLLQKVEQQVRKNGIRQIRLVTTNDNVNAMRFYQKKGFRLMEIHQNAVVKARRWKPEIPLIAENGIPICDELLLVKKGYK